jgi:hypothetical protein
MEPHLARVSEAREEAVGATLHAIRYHVGNPAVGLRMTQHDIRAGLECLCGEARNATSCAAVKQWVAARWI